MKRLPDFHDALLEEMRSDQVTALKKAVERMEKSLEALAAAAPDDPKRPDLVAAAGERAWYMIIQRETMGLTHTSEALDFYNVPGEVRAQIGLNQKASLQRRQRRQ